MTTRAQSVEFIPRNRLSKILAALNRKAFAEHVQNAEREVERLAPILGESIEGDVQALIFLCRQCSDPLEVIHPLCWSEDHFGWVERWQGSATSPKRSSPSCGRLMS